MAAQVTPPNLVAPAAMFFAPGITPVLTAYLARSAPGGKYGPRKIRITRDLVRQIGLEWVDGYQMGPFFSWDQVHRVYMVWVEGKSYNLPWWIRWTALPEILKNRIENRAQAPLHPRFFLSLNQFLCHRPIFNPRVDLIVEYFFFAQEVMSRTLTFMAIALLPNIHGAPRDGQFFNAFQAYIKRSSTPYVRVGFLARLRTWFMAYISRRDNLQSFMDSLYYPELVLNRGLFAQFCYLCIEAEQKFGNN